MRTSLLHPLTERHPRRHRASRRVFRPHQHEVRATPSTPRARDIAVERVRASGGPLDLASYGCECGYQFAAPVSTTVSCPHCGTAQAW